MKLAMPLDLSGPEPGVKKHVVIIWNVGNRSVYSTTGVGEKVRCPGDPVSEMENRRRPKAQM
jgi:hypothetical protein